MVTEACASSSAMQVLDVLMGSPAVLTDRRIRGAPPAPVVEPPPPPGAVSGAVPSSAATTTTPPPLPVASPELQVRNQWDDNLLSVSMRIHQHQQYAFATVVT